MTDPSSPPLPTDWRASLVRFVRHRWPWLLLVLAGVVVVAAAVMLYPAVFTE